MAGSANNDGDGEVTGINVTPLVDIMLVLLIIFMVTAKLIEHETIPIELPKAASGGAQTAKTLAIVIKEDGTTWVDEKQVDDNGLIRKIQESQAAREQLQAIISADKRALHGAVIHVMDVLKLNGVSKFAFEIEKPQ